MTLQNAYKILFTTLKPLKKSKTLDIYNSANRINAHKIIATKILPPFDNSAMDGYVLHFDDRNQILKVSGSILAGQYDDDIEIKRGETYKIMTGAKMPLLPKNSNFIVVQKENVELLENNQIKINSICKPNQNIRFSGEEINQNDVIANVGDTLNYLTLSMIASQGFNKIKVFENLNIGIYSTGDEIVELGKKAHAYTLYNTNALTIKSYLKSFDVDSTYLGILKDNTKDITAKILSFKQYDLIITSGGASVGDADLLKATLKKCGAKIIIDGVSTKPGKHISVAKLGKCIIFMLPGNPLALGIHLSSLLMPVIRFLSGANTFYPKAHIVENKLEFSLNKNVTNIVAGKLDNGQFSIYNNGKIGSSMITNLAKNDVLAFCNKDKFLVGEKILVVEYFMNFCDTISFINE